MTLDEWWQFLLPDNSNDLWTAIGAIATAIAGWAAFKIARNQFELEVLPQLHAERKTGKTKLINTGRGAALTVYGVAGDGDTEFLAASIGSEKELDISRIELTLNNAYFIFFKNAFGKRYKLKLVGSSISGKEPEFPIGATVVQVRWWHRTPAGVKSKEKRLSRSAFEHYLALSNRLSAEHWVNRAKKKLQDFKMWRDRRIYDIGEVERQRKYASLADEFPAQAPSAETVVSWDIDLNGISMGCWHTHPIEVEHWGFERRQEDRVCKVVVNRPFPSDPPYKGLVIVTDNAWDEIQSLPKSRRSDQIFEKLVRYLCARSPKGFFVCVVDKL